MKILLGLFSSVVWSTSFIYFSIGRIQQNVISFIVILCLLFTQCFTNNLPAKHQNDNIHSLDNSQQWQSSSSNSSHIANDIKNNVLIAPTKNADQIDQKFTTISSSTVSLSPLLFKEKPNKRRNGKQQIKSTTKQYQNFVDTSNTYKMLYSSSSLPPFTSSTYLPFSIESQKATVRRKKILSTTTTTTTNTVAIDVMILIQTIKKIQLNRVRDQFREFVDMFSIKLPNITIDFDITDGK